jgi:putative aldouronate transport system permease protein
MTKKAKLFKEFRNETIGDKLFDIIVYIIIAIAVVITIYPFIYVVSVSLSSGSAVTKGLVRLLPIGLDFSTYKMVAQYNDLWVSYGNTIFYTVTGTILNIIFTCLAAYPLSRRSFFLRRKLNFLLAFTMYFSGGLIPTYMVVTGLGLYNNRLAMILPVLVSAYNVMICRSAMEGISEELFENATLEGANDFVILTKIAIPLVKPTLAVLTLYYAVARYNDFFNALLYLGKSNLQPLQLFLRRILLMASTEVMQAMGSSAAGAGAAAQTTLQIRYVCIVFATVPIIMICPFIQKYLVKGTMLGAVKG